MANVEKVCALDSRSDDRTAETSSTNEAAGLREEVGVGAVETSDQEHLKKASGDSLYDLEPSDENCAFRMGIEVSVDPDVVDRLSSAFAAQILPSLEKAKSSISEIVSNQQVIIDTLEQENCKFKECSAFSELAITMLKAKEYYNKLSAIKKDMSSLHDRASKLKKRALKLQQQKQKEELLRAHQLERELERDQMLTAKEPGTMLTTRSLKVARCGSCSVFVHLPELAKKCKMMKNCTICIKIVQNALRNDLTCCIDVVVYKKCKASLKS